MPFCVPFTSSLSPSPSPSSLPFSLSSPLHSFPPSLLPPSASTWLCSFALCVSMGSALLLPVSIFSNEILVLYSHSDYVQWLNTSLIKGQPLLLVSLLIMSVSVCLSAACLSLPVCLSCLSVCLSVLYVSVCLSCLSVCLSVPLYGLSVLVEVGCTVLRQRYIIIQPTFV